MPLQAHHPPTTTGCASATTYEWWTDNHWGLKINLSDLCNTDGIARELSPTHYKMYCIFSGYSTDPLQLRRNWSASSWILKGTQLYSEFLWPHAAHDALSLFFISIADYFFACSLFCSFCKQMGSKFNLLREWEIVILVYSVFLFWQRETQVASFWVFLAKLFYENIVRCVFLFCWQYNF